MRIARLRIENLRAFKDETIPIDRHICLIGANGSGKSTVLHALNILFRESSGVSTDVTKLEDQDFHMKQTGVPVKITVTFTDLSHEAQEDFSDYFRQGELTICARAEFDPSTGFAEVKQYGLRRGMDDFRAFFEERKRKGSKVSDLKKIYTEFMQKYKDLPKPGTESEMVVALQRYEADHPDLCILIESSDEFYGFTRGKGRLERYVQWVFVPAIKDVLDEQMEARNTALGKILERTVREKVGFSQEIDSLKLETTKQYDSILKSKMDTLESLSKELGSKLREWAHPGATIRLEWNRDADKSIQIQPPFAEIVTGEGVFEGKLARFGHGLHRSYLFSLLHVLSNCDDLNSPTLILGCEEPELFQHPPQLRHLTNVFRELSKKNSQIVLCTHSPHFVSGQYVEEVRLVRKDTATCEAKVTNVTLDQIANLLSTAGSSPEESTETMLKIHQSLQPELNEMFFTQKVVFVEGLEDLAYITTYMHLLRNWEEFRRLGCHIIPTEGKRSMIRPLAIANALRIPCFVVFDTDGHVRDNGSGKRAQHEKDNRALLHLLGDPGQKPFPDSIVWSNRFVAWNSELKSVLYDELKATGYELILNSTRNGYGDPGGIEKNVLFIADVLATAWNEGIKSAILEKLCTSILAFARN